MLPSTDQKFAVEVLRRIKADENLQTIPVVVLTSSREESDIVESYQLGVNSYASQTDRGSAFMVYLPAITQGRLTH